MIYISMSLIKDLLDCPKKLDFRTGGSVVPEPSKEMSEGNIVHAVLEKTWNNQKLAQDALKEELAKYSIKLDVKKMETCIKNFFIMYGGNLSSSDDIEKFFKVRYSKDVTLVGKFDRIHNNVIYDWKTGKFPPVDMNKDVQFMIYYLAYRLINKKDPSAMVYVHLPSKRNYIFKPKESYLEEFEATMFPYIISEVKKKDKIRLGIVKYGICQKCTFRRACLGEESDV
jgi:hypothetical protein